MEPVGEEEEEEEEEEEPRRKPVDHAEVALQQKARIVSQMAALRVSPQEHIEPPQQPEPQRERRAMAPARSIPAAVPAPPRESRTGKQRPSLFSTVAKTLTDALHMAQSPPGFYAPCESLGFVWWIGWLIGQQRRISRKRQGCLSSPGWITVPSMVWDLPWPTVLFVSTLMTLQV